jgi:hypothetical protein
MCRPERTARTGVGPCGAVVPGGGPVRRARGMEFISARVARFVPTKIRCETAPDFDGRSVRSLPAREASPRLFRAVVPRAIFASVRGPSRCAAGPARYGDELPLNALWRGRAERGRDGARRHGDDGRWPHDEPQRCDGVQLTDGLLISPCASPVELQILLGLS